MCEERERLIGYVYDECDAGERRAIEAHLESCPVCRREIGDLRGVRQDLLAWRIPDHEPVWRPVPPPRVDSQWSAVPAWAMAAAAGLILMAGALGGAASYAVLPAGARQAAAAPVSAPATMAPASVTSPGLSALEQRVLALEKAGADLGQRVELMSTHAPAPDLARVNALASELATQVNALSTRQNELSRTLYAVYNETQGLTRRQSGLRDDLMNMVSLTRQDQTPAGGR